MIVEPLSLGDTVELYSVGTVQKMLVKNASYDEVKPIGHWQPFVDKRTPPDRAHPSVSVALDDVVGEAVEFVDIRIFFSCMQKQ